MVTTKYRVLSVIPLWSMTLTAFGGRITKTSQREKLLFFQKQ
jgi:hypothetical protein